MNEETINKLHREELTKITVKRGRLVVYFVLLAFSLICYIDYTESVAPAFTYVRLITMAPALFFLIYTFTLYKKYPKIALPFYAFAVFSIILQLGWMVYMSVLNPEVAGSIYKHSLSAFTTAIFAGVITIWGARKYLFAAYMGLFVLVNIAFIFAIGAEARMVVTVNCAIFFGSLYLLLSNKEDRTRFIALKELEDKERELFQKAKELEQVNTELESFNYSISHDLKTPLRNATSFAQLLTRQIEEEKNPRVHEFADYVINNLHKMHELTEALLNLSHIGKHKLKREKIDFSILAKDVVSELIDNREIEIIYGDLPVVEADKVLMRQVYFNLIANAIKYTAKTEHPVIEIGSKNLNGQKVYYVKDNGAGFDMAYKKKLFKIFQRLHSPNEFEGSGVGLSIAQRIILYHDGKIWAESKIGEGAAFYFSL